jgi:predicted ATPase
MLPPFSTRWVVFTGAPCSGKTSVAKYLAGLGYSVLEEAARVISATAFRDGTLESLRGDENAFTELIARQRLQTEASLEPKMLHFLDRGLPDLVAFARAHNDDSNRWVALGAIFRYAFVFHFERLSLIKDSLRTETEDLCIILDQHTRSVYDELEYRVVSVPLFPGEVEQSIARRAEFVLSLI